MSSLFGHALAGLAVSSACSKGRPERRLWVTAMACAVAPDLDWFSAFLPLREGTSLAHRGITHSLIATLLITLAALLLAFRSRLREPRLWACLFSATLSHSLLDALTFGGTGVAFLLPFSETRFVGVWQPLFVSPIPLSGNLFEWLLFSLSTECLWIGLPALMAFGLPRAWAWAWTRRARRLSRA